MTYPRPVTSLHQIEITSRCSLRCVYCPSPAIMAGKIPERPAVDMTLEHFERAMQHVAFYVRTAGQQEVNLAGIGESTLHPLFPEFVALARGALGPRGKLIFATNGVAIAGTPSEDLPRLAARIAPYNPRVWVSLHRPEKAAAAVNAYRAVGILDGVSTDPVTNGNDWAGQVEWPGHGAPMTCGWLRDGRVMVMADGRVTTCCLDAHARGVIGLVGDPLGFWRTSPYSLCATCHHTIVEPQ